jgi:ketosteroid isomerase-like protein
MSQENVEIVRRYYEAYDREDHDGWKALLARPKSSSSRSV